MPAVVPPLPQACRGGSVTQQGGGCLGVVREHQGAGMAPLPQLSNCFSGRRGLASACSGKLQVLYVMCAAGFAIQSLCTATTHHDQVCEALPRNLLLQLVDHLDVAAWRRYRQHGGMLYVHACASTSAGSASDAGSATCLPCFHNTPCVQAATCTERTTEPHSPPHAHGAAAAHWDDERVVPLRPQLLRQPLAQGHAAVPAVLLFSDLWKKGRQWNGSVKCTLCLQGWGGAVHRYLPSLQGMPNDRLVGQRLWGEQGTHLPDVRPNEPLHHQVPHQPRVCRAGKCSGTARHRSQLVHGQLADMLQSSSAIGRHLALEPAHPSLPGGGCCAG